MTTMVAAGLLACRAEPDTFGPQGPELRALVDEHCQSVSDCSCASELVADGCTDALLDRWEERRTAAKSLGLEYDVECFDTLHSQIADYDCYWPGGSTPLCSSFCAVFHGDAELGQPCEGHDDQASTCAQGLLCSQGTCVEPCAALGGRLQGESCGSPEFGIYDDCAPGLWCNLQSYVCTPLPAEGQDCFDASCGPDLYCNWQTLVCEPAATQGQSCDFRQCADDLYCEWLDGQQTCQPYAQPGESCSGRPCRSDLYCNDDDLCVEAPREAEPCLWGSICAAGYVCDGAVGACVTPPDAGELCIQGSCSTGSWCDVSEVPEGVCALAMPNGEMCAGHRQCESNYCPNGFCWARPLLGEPCEGTGACAAGLVCNGTTCEPTSTRAPAACSYPGW
ncbi:MAG: hypothetical protein KDK70_19230 [Myxococcales bacterium]|nr:hypothetical protein [Myxococcales bacterium]